MNHSIVIRKSDHCGIRGVVLEWFKSYSTNRKQLICVNGHCSKILNITCGVPQGSVLGPLLFLLYINDLPNISKKLKFYLFADDTNLYFSSNDLDYLQTVVNKELKKFHKWLRANRLALNIDKTNCLIFHSAQVQLPHPKIIKIDKKPITHERSVKYLGMILDPPLSWKPHTTELAKKTFWDYWNIL